MWEAAAPGWERRQEAMRSFAAPVSHWMVDAIHPQPGQRVLELAAGIGETGFLAAELLAPSGGVITSDQSEAMLGAARRRASQLELSNVEFQVLNAEWIDLPVGSVDGVLCRWGFMLMADPATALRETRRVLRPQGRVALAVWDEAAVNPWVALPGRLMVERGLSEPPAADGPGVFALAAPGRVAELLRDAGFTEVQTDTVDVKQRSDSFDAYWEQLLDMSPIVRDAVAGQGQQEIDALRAGLRERLGEFTAQDGSLAIPGRTIVAAATA